MKQILLICGAILLYTSFGFSQNALPVVKATGGEGLNKKWVKPKEETDGPNSWIYSDCSNSLGNYKASTTLASQGKQNYEVKNLIDDNPTTPWVEGSKGYGIGDYIDVENFSMYSGINIANGYQRNPATFIENSRVKSFKFYLNKKPVCIIELKDEMGIQSVAFPAIIQKLIEAMAEKSVVRLEIADVYKGTKWDDVAISEIYTQGCCINKGSEVTLFDGKTKTIESLNSFDTLLVLLETGNAKAIISGVEKVVYESGLTFQLQNGKSITVSNNHPMFDAAKGNFKKALLFEVGESLLTTDEKYNLSESKITNITQLMSTMETYHFKNISILNQPYTHNFKIIVNGIVTTDEKLLLK